MKEWPRCPASKKDWEKLVMKTWLSLHRQERRGKAVNEGTIWSSSKKERLGKAGDERMTWLLIKEAPHSSLPNHHCSRKPLVSKPNCGNELAFTTSSQLNTTARFKSSTPGRQCLGVGPLLHRTTIPPAMMEEVSENTVIMSMMLEKSTVALDCEQKLLKSSTPSSTVLVPRCSLVTPTPTT